jgi:hypothetical protein
MIGAFRHRAFRLVLTLAAVGACATACGQSNSEPRPPQPSAGLKAEFESSVREAYGRYLDQLDVAVVWIPHVGGRPDAEGKAPPGAWAFRADFSLVGLPLKFWYIRLAVDPFSGRSTYGGTGLTHSDIGGTERFWQLADQYHHDFPTQPTFNYWLNDTNDIAMDEPYRTLLKRHPGIQVVIYAFDDYWSDASAPVLAVYWWDNGRKQWVLLRRGPLPDGR